MSEVTNRETVEVANQILAELQQAARDGQLIQNGYYSTEAAGRAAVADGETIKVQGTGDIAAILYRRTSSTVSVKLAEFPTVSAAMATLGTISTGALSDYSAQGAFTVAQSAVIADLPAGATTASSLTLVNQKRTTDGRFVLQHLYPLYAPADGWVRPLDKNNPTTGVWTPTDRESYRGQMAAGSDLNSTMYALGRFMRIS